MLNQEIASSRSSIYHLSGNRQTEKTVGTVWKAIQLALKTRHLLLLHYECVLDNILHLIRSFLCVIINSTPHDQFFNFLRRLSFSKSLPRWLTSNGKAFVKRFVRNSKNDPYVDEVELTNASTTYVEVRYRNGHEATVSTRDLAPCPPAQNNDVSLITKVLQSMMSLCKISQIQQLVLTMKMKAI